MASKQEDTDADQVGPAGSTRRFPFARTIAPPTPGGFIDLGITPLARLLGLTMEQTNGHWCSRCRGIWFGYTLETQCPVCGNRKG